VLKTALIVLGVLVALVGILALIGSFLAPDHTASRTRRFAKPREAVWEVIRDFARHPEWRDDVKRVELVTDVGGKSGLREHGSHGAVLYAIDVDEAPAKLVLRIADDSLPFGGSWTFELSAVEGGSEVTITERGFVKNPIFRLLSKTVFSPTATMEKYLDALAAKLAQ
jgi:uncharacterized protein YndB with AHSA1/START domain